LGEIGIGTVAMMACFCRRFPITMHCRSFGTIPSSTTTTTIDGTKAFFGWLEKTYGARFGGKPLPMDGRGTNSSSGNSTNKTQTKNQMVVTKGSLELEDLERLFRHEIAVLKITNFYPRDASASLGRALAREGQHSNAAQNWKVSTSKGLESSDVVTVGRHSPYNIAVANQATDEYFREVRNELRDRRGLALHVRNGNGNGNTDAPQQTKEEGHRQPVLWPLDLLRLELDEVWPRGAGLARANTTAAATATGNAKNNNNNCMGGGLPRLMVGPTRWKKGLVHVDELAPLSDQHGCFSANIYLQLPYTYKEHSDSSSSVVDTTTTSSKINESFSTKEQPIMEVWPLGIRSKWDWYRVGTMRGSYQHIWIVLSRSTACWIVSQ